MEKVATLAVLVSLTFSTGALAAVGGTVFGPPESQWAPSSGAVRAAARTPSHYDGAPPWNGRSGCAKGLAPRAVALADGIRRAFGPLPIGGYTCRPNTAAPNRTSVHGTGRALDVMTTQGDAIADWLLTHATEHGVQLVIWKSGVWKAGRSGVRHYGGPNPHTDHLHVEVIAGSTDGVPDLTDRRPRLIPLEP